MKSKADKCLELLRKNGEIPKKNVKCNNCGHEWQTSSEENSNLKCSQCKTNISISIRE